MNLYNIFEGLNDPKNIPTAKVVGNTNSDEQLRDYANNTADMAKGEVANNMTRMFPDTTRKDPKMGMQEEGVTEDLPQVIDEVAMNPSVFAQAIKTGQDKGVLVGFEFETCIPKASVDTWKNGPAPAAPEIPQYDATSTAWVDGKTTNDLIDGIAARGNGRYSSVFDDVLKYKGSVKTATGKKDPWSHYVDWAHKKINEFANSQDTSNLTFKALSEMLKDPEVKEMEVNYGNSEAVEKFGNSNQWNGKTFTIAVLKDMTGVDFGKRVPKAALTPELAKKVREAMQWAYYKTNGPYDRSAQNIANAVDRAKSQFQLNFFPSGGWGGEEFTETHLAAMKQHFAEFCQETMGTTDLKTLLKTKWAFKGRVNNNSETLKEKLWYYLTPNAPQPASLAPRSYNRGGDYMDGAEFLKANLKDVYGANMEIFRGYHQATKKLDRWYIEPDGSLRPNSNDYSAEVVSPPLPAADAMTALRTWYSKAQEMKLYTNNSTGLHINVSIPGNLDVLKLAVFSGDQYVLKQFGREDNSYARSVIKNLKGNGSLPTVGSDTFKDAEKQMKEIVKRISGDHFATVNFNGKYVSFRHAGGDYLNKAQDIANTVGRFVRSMMIAADPAAYRDEYVAKLVKMMKAPEAADGDKMALSDIRQYAQRGIPVEYIDFFVRPRDPSDPTPRDFSAAVEQVKKWGRDKYGVDPVITRDDGARARLMNGRGLASASKEMMDQLPDDMFFQAMVVPNSRRKLEKFADDYSRYGTDAGSAFSFYDNGHKIATATHSRKTIKQDDPQFAEVINALRGGTAKPLPLPGAKGTPSMAASTFASQRPAQQEPERTDTQRNGERRNWIVYNPNNNPDGANPAHGLRRDNMNTTEIVQAVHEIEDQQGFARGTLRVRYADEQQSGEEQTYNIVDTNTGDTIQHYHGTLADTRQVAQSRADSEGHTMRIERASDDESMGYVEPNWNRDTDGEHNREYEYTIVDQNNRAFGNGYRTEDEALASAQQLANENNRPMFVNDPAGERIGGARPEESSHEYRPLAPEYTFLDNDGTTRAQAQMSSDESALQQAVEMAQRRGQVIGVRRGDVFVGWGHPNGSRQSAMGSNPQQPTRTSTTDTTDPVDEGITAPGGSDNNDSTSPVGGSGLGSYEADYDDDYQDMVKRVGQKAREQEKRKPVDLAKLAQRLREDAKPVSQASRELLRVARQSNPEALSDTDAIYGYLGSIAKKTQDNYKQVNNILRQLDPLSAELDRTEQELGNVERINGQQQELLRRLNQRVDQVKTQALPSQQRAAMAAKAEPAAAKEREVISQKLDNLEKQQQAPQVAQQPNVAQQPQTADVADAKARQDIEAVNQHIKDLEQRLHAKDVANSAKEQIIKDMYSAKSALTGMNAGKIAALAQSIKPNAAQQTLPFDEEAVYESRLYAMRKAGYDIL